MRCAARQWSETRIVDRIIDTAELVYAYLMAQPSLVDEVRQTVGTATVVHIYGPPGVPPNWTLRKAVTYARMGGTGSDDVPIMTEQFQFRCYGPSVWDAVSVYRRLMPVLQRIAATRVTLSNGVGLLQYARLISGPTDTMEPQTKWPMVMATFEIRSGEFVLP